MKRKRHRCLPDDSDEVPAVDHEFEIYCHSQDLLPITVDKGVQVEETCENLCHEHSYSCTNTMSYDGSNGESDNHFEFEVIGPCLEVENEAELVIYDADIAENVTVDCDEFDKLFYNMCERIQHPFVVIRDDKIRVMEHYETTVKLCVAINTDFKVELFVHNRVVAASNSIFSHVGKGIDIFEDIMNLISKLKVAHVCIGNPEPEFVAVVPEDGNISSSSCENLAFREGNFGAKRSTFIYTCTVRAVECDLLLMTKNDRCGRCSKVRSILRCREYRKKEAASSGDRTFLHTNYKHSQMDRDKLILKLDEQKNEIKSLQSEVNKLKRQLSKQNKEKGQTRYQLKLPEWSDLKAKRESKVRASYPDENSSKT